MFFVELPTIRRSKGQPFQGHRTEAAELSASSARGGQLGGDQRGNPEFDGRLATGSRVQIVAQDGNRHPATFVQEQNGHYLCATPDGQQRWIPAQNVSPG